MHPRWDGGVKRSPAIEDGVACSEGGPEMGGGNSGAGESRISAKSAREREGGGISEWVGRCDAGALPGVR